MDRPKGRQRVAIAVRQSTRSCMYDCGQAIWHDLAFALLRACWAEGIPPIDLEPRQHVWPLDLTCAAARQAQKCWQRVSMDDYRHCRKMAVGTAGKALAAWIGRRTCTESHRAQDDIRRRVCAYVCVQRRACVRVYQLAPGNNERIGNRSICLLTDCTSP